ncbi:SpaA isopeptide-forming pilin-related protein [Anaerococcus martiniensis]|uniref:SpaA isopeptide-forming pilin-related protein n=1 Tax=Anaerococcus sp. WGS1579 TaxID=3366809 RepID=UPI00372D2F99
MKGKLNNYLLKLSSLVLAFILVFPTEIFAMAMDDKASTYNASTSIMGLATQTQNPEENSTESTDEKQTLIKSEISTDETDEYLIEKSATLSKTTGQIDYKILVKSKKSDDKDKNQTAIFAITQNTDLKDLKVEKVQELSADGTEKDAEYTQNTASLFTPQDNQRTFGITTTSAENAMVYYLSAKLSDEALADIDKKSPNMDLEFAIKKLENIYQSRYALEIAKPQENDIIIDNNGDLKNQEESLKEITDNTHQYKAIYKEESQGLFANTPAQITWTDYINNKDDKEFTYDINLDQNQDTSESQINIQYYEASEKGYILNESFTKTIPFTNSLKLTIPQGYIAQVELTTRPRENVKEYTFNGAKVANPTYKEEKTPAKEESKKEDTDPLPAEEKPETQKAEEAPATETNSSAIALNKDSLLSKFKNEEKLNNQIEAEVDKITNLLETYNNEEITWEEFVAEVKSTALSKADFIKTINTLTAGLAEDKYKVANIDADELANEIYPAEESKKEEASEEEKETTKTVDELVKAKLADPKTTIEDFQNYMYELETEYALTNEDAARIYGDNAEAIEALINRHREESLDPWILAVIEEDGNYKLNGSFYVTRNANLYPGQDTPEGTKIIINHSEYLTHDGEVEDLENKAGKVIATGTYDRENKQIIYTITNEINNMSLSSYDSVKFSENFKLKDDLEENKEYIIENSMEIIKPDGTKRTVKMSPNRVTIENDKAIDPSNPLTYTKKPNALYHVDYNATFKENKDPSGNIESLDWTVTIDGDKSLGPDVKDLSQLGLIINFTGPYGSGLEGPENILVNGEVVPDKEFTSNEISDPHVDYSYNYKPIGNEGRRKYVITFTTPVSNNEGTHVLDINYTLANVRNYDGGAGRVGRRSTTDSTETPDVIKQLPGAKTLIVGEYDEKDKTRAHWTISDSTETKDLEGLLPKSSITITNQELEGAIRATTYSRDSNGKMRKDGETTFSSLSEIKKGVYPVGANKPGTIVVYDFYTKNLSTTEKPSVTIDGEKAELGLLGKDLTIKTEWKKSLGDSVPPYKMYLVSDEVDENTGATEKVIKEIPVELNGSTHEIKLENLPQWTTDKYGNPRKINYHIRQDLPAKKTDGDATNNQIVSTYYLERSKNYNPETNTITIKNEVLKKSDDGRTKKLNDGKGNALWDNSFEPRDITIRKFADDGKTPLAGATFELKTSDSNAQGEPYRSYTGTTDSNGYVTFYDVEPNDYGKSARYILTETKAPSGYIRNSNSEIVTVDSHGRVYWEPSSNILNTPNPPQYTRILNEYKSDTTFQQEKRGTVTSTIQQFVGFEKPANNVDGEDFNEQNTEANYYVVIHKNGAGTKAHSSKLLFDVGKDATINYIDIKDFHTYKGWVKNPPIKAAKTKFENKTFTLQDFETLPSANLITHDERNILPTIHQDGHKADIIFDNDRFKSVELANKEGDGWTYIVKVNVTIDNANAVKPKNFTYKLTDSGLSGDYKEREMTGSIVLPAVKKVDLSVPVDPIEITNKPIPNASVALTKTDKENKRLKGATFTIEDESGNIFDMEVSDDNGDIVFDDLRPGTYFIRESKAPEGYQKTGNYFKVVVTNEEEKDSTTGQINNIRKIRYQEYDQNGNKIGAEGEGNSVATGKSDNDLKKGIFIPETPTMTITRWGKGTDGKIRSIGEHPNGNPGVYDLLINEGVEFQTKIRFNKSVQGDKFSIKFDDKLNLTFTVNKFPDITDKNGDIIAKAGVFNPDTNTITYTVTDYLTRHHYDFVEADLTVRGITLNRQKYKDLSGTFNTGYILRDNDVETTFSSEFADGTQDSQRYRVDNYNVPVNFGDYAGKYVKYGTNYSQTYFKDEATGKIYKTYAPGRQRYIKYIAYYNANDQYVRNDGTWPRVQFIWKENMNLKEFRVYDVPYEIGNDYNRVAMPTSYGIEPETDKYIRNGKERSYDKILDLKTGSQNLIGSTAHTNYRYIPGNNAQVVGPEILNPKLEMDLNTNRINTESIKNLRYRDGKVFEFDFAVANEDKDFYDQYYGLTMYTRQWLDDYRVLNSQGFGHAFIGELNDATAEGAQYIPPNPKPANINFTNDMFNPGRFIINKTDNAKTEAEKRQLQGAQFILRKGDENGEIIKNLTTGTDGKVQSGDLAPGIYTLEEVKAPDGYKIGEKDTWKIEIDDKGQVKVDGRTIKNITETVDDGIDKSYSYNNSQPTTKTIYYKDNSGSAGSYETSIASVGNDEYLITTTVNGSQYNVPTDITSYVARNSGVPKTIYHNDAANGDWPEFMMLQHYLATKDPKNKKVEYYALLNPDDNSNMNKNSDFKINVANMNIESISVFNVDPSNAGSARTKMQSFNGGSISNSVATGANEYPITVSGSGNERTVYLPQQRFGFSEPAKWKFLVKVTGTVIDPKANTSVIANWTARDARSYIADARVSIAPIEEKSQSYAPINSLRGTLTHNINTDAFNITVGETKFNINSGKRQQFFTRVKAKDNLAAGTYPILNSAKLDLPDLKGDSRTTELKNGASITVTDTKRTKEVEKVTAFQIDIENPPITGKFIVQKVGEDGVEKLTGAEFKLYKLDENGEANTNNPIGQIVVKDSDGREIPGRIEFTDLKDGDYLLEETKAPVGYEISKAKWNVSVKDGKVNIRSTDGSADFSRTDDTITLNIVNKKPSNTDFMIKKVDASDNNNPLSKVEFELYDSNKNKIKSATTNDKGELYFSNVPNGTYYLKEIVPENYQAESKWTTIVVKDGEVTFTHSDTFTDESADKSGLTELFTSVMNVFDTSARDITMTADKPSDFVSENITTYTIKNYQNPDVTLYKFGVLENTKDYYDTEVLSNVEFVLQKRENDQWVEKQRAKSASFTGAVKFTNLEAGEYRLLEPNAPEGYRQPDEDEAVKSFVVRDGKIYTTNSKGQELEISDKNNNNDIINIKKGEGNIEIIKTGDSGEKLKGVEFELWNYDALSMIAKKATDKDGRIDFENLNYGRYWLKETKTLPGYILEDRIRSVVVTKGYDLPSGISGKDISKQLRVAEKSLVSTTNSRTEVYPNDAEGLFANIKLSVADQTNPKTKIKPGDTFYIRLSDNLDLDGIGKADAKILDGRFDIIGPFGTLAKAEIQSDKKTIKYTFTNYLENRTLGSKIDLTIPVFVDRFKVLNNSTETFGFSLGDINNLDSVGQNNFTNQIAVKYFDKYNRDTAQYINLMPLKVDHDTKEFRMLAYVNMKHENTYNKLFYFTPSLDVENLNIKVYNFGNAELPHSYGVDLSGRQFTNNNLGNVEAYSQNGIYVSNNRNSNAYVLEITGKISSDKPTTMTTRSWYYANNANSNAYRQYYWDTHTKFYGPNGSADATPMVDNPIKLEIINDKNRINFLKVAKSNKDGSEYDYLEGAEFELRKLNAEGIYVKVADKEKVKSNKFGLFGWSEIPQGEYQVWETKAPEGYQLPEGGKEVATFEVDQKGIVKNISNILIENEKIPQASLPSTGGNGAFIGFAIIGTAVMLAGIAYFAIYQNDKNRRRSDRYGR